MANVLKSVLRNPLFELLCKVLFWIFSLVWLKFNGVYPLNVFLVFAILFWIYFRTKSSHYSFGISFVLVIFLSFLSVLYLAGPIFGVVLFFLGMIVLFLGGVNDLLFFNNLLFYRLSLFFLFFLSYLFFFTYYDPSFFFLKYAVLLFISIILFYEAFGLGEKNYTKRMIFSTVLSLILAEIVWLLVILPIHAVGAASFLAIINFLLVDYCFRRIENKKNDKLQIIFGAVFFMVIGVLVMIFTKWGV